MKLKRDELLKKLGAALARLSRGRSLDPNRRGARRARN